MPPQRASEASDASPADAEPSSDAGGGAKHASIPARTPLSGFPEQLELREEAAKHGFVAVPLGASEPRPIVIALHGGSEKPEVACRAWRRVTEGYPFVVCPRGFGGNESALGWRSPSDTAERIAQAIGATKKVFGSWVKDTSSVVLVGFSMGGSQVALLARAAPQRYRRIVVGDSAHDPQPALTFSPTWVKGGGERAMFLCTTSGCEPALRRAAHNVKMQKGAARLNIAPTQVHGLSEPAVQSMRRDWAWLVENAEGWDRYVAPSQATLPGKTEAFTTE